MINPLLQLIKYGQSYWLDDLTRQMITSGELKQRVTEQGLRGITSNPSTFHKSIAGSSDYDAQIKQLVQEGREVHDIYERLTVTDVQDACDILRPVYKASDGVDGYVSLEVSPYLAHHTAGTMAEARRLFQAVDRPNLLIKIPGTPAGVPAIEAMLYEGININITLLFGIKDYEAVAQAYIHALERRLAEGKPIRSIASVASFFLSRIDVIVDQLLGHRIQPGAPSGDTPRPEQLLGQVAVANAKLAYQSFKRIFGSERWHALEQHGARVQRPLWASTGTKDPLYDDVRYVEPLIGPHTVNTMPAETIAAFADHGVIAENTVEANVAEARQILRDLEHVGINLDFVTQQLQDEGGQKFIDPYDALMTALASKREAFLGDQTNPHCMALGALEGAVEAAFASLDGRQFGRRLAAHDAWLWTSDEAQSQTISQRLGWFESPAAFRHHLADIQHFALDVKQAGVTAVVLLGMGGSSLGAEVCRDSFGAAPGWPQLFILDNPDAAALHEVEAHIDLGQTLFLVASKSGTTTETLSLYRYFRDQLQHLRPDRVGDAFVAITDPGSPLAQEAQQSGFRRCFENPPDIGGRYAVLSYFGLVPMALLGIDLPAVLQRAQHMRVSCGPQVPAGANPGVRLGTLLGLAARRGRDKVTFVLGDALRTFGAWAEQLLAESTGKDGKGLVPVVDESLGGVDVYGPDRLFVSIQLAEQLDTGLDKHLEALENAGHPVVRITLPTLLGLGAECFRWEVATAVAGAIMSVNPFDEPNVDESKQHTRELLDVWQQHGTFGADAPLVAEDALSLYGAASHVSGDTVQEALRAFVEGVTVPDYLALLAYFHPTPARHELLQTLRLALRNRCKVATTLGYGPRYLHSTGQLHKGGPNTGVFLLMTADEGTDVPIPGAAYGFATLKQAQALGDFQALEAKNRRVLRLHIHRDIEKSLERVAAYIL